jgi:hypothetical protein
MSDQLVALAGGPYDGHWYWLADWNTRRSSTQALPDVLLYQPTGQMVDNPNPAYGKGEVWRYRSPAGDDYQEQIVTLASGFRAVVCPRCARPAPTLIVFSLAHRDAPIRECPRCAYPAQRYLGDYVETMPERYLDWYEAHEYEAVVTTDDHE